MEKVSIQGLIDKHLKEKNDEPRNRSGKFSPSLLGACYRRQYWNRLDEPKTNPPDERALRIFAVGNIFHEFVQQFIEKEKTEVVIETENFYGRADIVTEDAVVDIKSQHSKGFWWMKKEGYDISKEKYNNIMQVVFYAKELGKPWARLVFISKDDLIVEEYGFSVEKWLPEIEKEINTLVELWRGGKLPEAEPRLYGGKECEWCAYLDKCKEYGGKVWTEKATAKSTKKA